MKKCFVVYKITYFGNRLPPFYIGSTSEQKLINGYRGSIRSKKWKRIFMEEKRTNPSLFSYEVLSRHKTREMATKHEMKLQKELDVVKSSLFFNEAIATKNGSHGRDVSGASNPMHGRVCEIIAIDRNGKTHRVSKDEFKLRDDLQGVTGGFVYAKDKTTGSYVKLSRERYRADKSKYIHCNHGRKASAHTIDKLRKQRHGFATVKDANGVFCRVHKDDPRLKTGELVNIHSKQWNLVSPCGDSYKTHSLKLFCKQHDLRLGEKTIIENGKKKYRYAVRDASTGDEWNIFEMCC